MSNPDMMMNMMKGQMSGFLPQARRLRRATYGPCPFVSSARALSSVLLHLCTESPFRSMITLARLPVSQCL